MVFMDQFNDLGELIAQGANLLAFKVDLDYFFGLRAENNVLIITEEHRKFEFYSKILKEEGIVIDRLPEEKFMSNVELKDEKYQYLNELRNKGFDIFYMPLLEKLSSEEMECAKDYAINIQLTFGFGGTGMSPFKEGELPVNSLACFNGSMDIYERIGLATAKAAEITNKTVKIPDDFSNGRHMELDVHEHQYAKYKGKIFCLDVIVLCY